MVDVYMGVRKQKLYGDVLDLDWACHWGWGAQGSVIWVSCRIGVSWVSTCNVHGSDCGSAHCCGCAINNYIEFMLRQHAEYC